VESAYKSCAVVFVNIGSYPIRKIRKVIKRKGLQVMPVICKSLIHRWAGF